MWQKIQSIAMEIDKSKIRISQYSPNLHKQLLAFMCSQYENRSPEYLDWWLTNLDNSNSNMWATAFIVFYDNDIVGCYTSSPISITIDGQTTPMFYGGNAIITPEFRGAGIGKKMYVEVFKHSNRISIGLTAASYAIQTQKFQGCYPINGIRVYVSANRYTFHSLLNRLLNKTSDKVHFPHQATISGYNFSHVTNIDSIKEFPDNGIWLNDFVELTRDKEWLKNRFINIYRKQDYFIYTIHKDNSLVGYAVYRKGKIYGVEFISIVDFRCRNIQDEKYVTKMANKIAKANKIGFTFCMSSRLHPIIRFAPFTIRLRKKIKNVTVVEGIKDKEILFTSADSNLDFVYYE